MTFRMETEKRVRLDLELRERHKKMWPRDCPAVDLDFLMCEYNDATPVTIVDYKHHLANLSLPDRSNERTLSELYNATGDQLPFFWVKYWPDVWAFKVSPRNDAARQSMARLGFGAGSAWTPMSERDFVRMLLLLRKEALHLGDERTLLRLSDEMPPDEEAVAS